MKAITAVLLLLSSVIHAQAADEPYTVLITGASRGIGFELAKQYAGKGWRVIATARDPRNAEELKALAASDPDVIVEKLDVTKPRTIETVARKYRGQPIDVLINNAGILGDNEKQKFGTLDYSSFDAVMDTNTKGPIRMVEAFVDNVVASRQKKIMNISSYVGSIDKTFGGQVFYRASKAALNMSMRTFSREFKLDKQHPERKQLIVGLIDPGVVETGFSKKLPIPMISAERSAGAVIGIIERYTLEKSGSFYTWSGGELPW
jgi:NAD(P)-dependent dehydrogenase (short-subunit alcohol dehydrogenase family)